MSTEEKIIQTCCMEFKTMDSIKRGTDETHWTHFIDIRGTDFLKTFGTSYRPYFGDMEDYLKQHYNFFCQSMNNGEKMVVARVFFPVDEEPYGYLKTPEGMKRVLKQMIGNKS